ncbi:MAG: sulfotransferase [Alphaproteobacteria bacterium]|nr:sulfotransferase [Alphaproteobacteria bacterium]
MQALQQAVQFHQQGRWQQAMSLYKDVLKTQPKNPDALHLLGLLEAQHESFDKGTARMKKAFKLAPNNSQILNNLANLYSSQERHKEALDLYDKALLLDPMNLGAQENKGYASYNISEFEDAVECLSGLVPISKNPKMFAYLGAAHRELKQEDEALAAFDKGLSLGVPQVDLYIESSRLFEKMGQKDKAKTVLSKAVSMDEEPEKCWKAFGTFLLRSRDYSRAIPALKKVINLDADNTGFAHANIGYCYQLKDDLTQAKEWYELALKKYPDCSLAYAHFGTYHAILGDMDKAKECTEKAIELAPEETISFYTYSNVHKFTEAHPNTALYEKIAWSSDTMIDDTIRLSFALSKMYWDIKEDEKSFVHLARANAMMFEDMHYDASKDATFMDSLNGIYDTAQLDAQLDVKPHSQTPIFLVGMPRSGTTLTEQILGAHPDVYPAGELPHLLEFIEKDMGGVADLSELGKIFRDDEKLKALREYYLQKLTELTDKPFVVDKMPHNFMILGLIKRAFPEAKIIHCSRDAVATCFSCFRQMFSRKHHYSYNLKALGRYYKAYANYMSEMAPKMPDMYESSYDKLVEAPEDCTRALVDAAGLPWDDACLSPHKNTGKVLTASFVQARAPIHSGSKQSWKRVEKHLKPLIEALKP